MYVFLVTNPEFYKGSSLIKKYIVPACMQLGAWSLYSSSHQPLHALFSVYVCLCVTLLRFDSFITTLQPFYACTQPPYSEVCYGSGMPACRPGQSLRSPFFFFFACQSPFPHRSVCGETNHNYNYSRPLIMHMAFV